MATNEYILDGLRTYGQSVLVCADATRSRALEIRKLAKAEGLTVSIQKRDARLIALYVKH